MFSCILSMMRGMIQGAGYQKVAKSNNKIWCYICKYVYMLWNPKSRPVAMGCNFVAKWRPALCKNYYETEKNAKSYVVIYKKNL